MSWLAGLIGGKLGPYVAGGVGVLFALVLAWGGVTSLRLNHAKHDLETARLDLKSAQASLGQCQANRSTLSTELDAQNAAVAALKDRADQLTAQAEKAAQQAARARQSASSLATSILNTKAGSDRCASALAILKGNAG